MRKMLLAAVSGVALMAVQPASANIPTLDFSFSFSNTVGNVDGTVTGVIKGLLDNASSMPSEIVITSYPSTPYFDVGFTPISLVVASADDVTGSFTVTNGQITGGSLIGLFAYYGIGLQLNGVQGSNSLYSRYSQPWVADRFVANADGLAGVTFTPVAPVPLPAALPLLASGLAGLGLIRRRAA